MNSTFHFPLPRYRPGDVCLPPRPGGLSHMASTGGLPVRHLRSLPVASHAALTPHCFHH